MEKITIFPQKLNENPNLVIDKIFHFSDRGGQPLILKHNIT